MPKRSPPKRPSPPALATPLHDANLKALLDDPEFQAMAATGKRWEEVALPAAHAAARPYREALAGMTGRDLTPAEVAEFDRLTDEASRRFRETLREHGFSEDGEHRDTPSALLVALEMSLMAYGEGTPSQARQSYRRAYDRALLLYEADPSLPAPPPRETDPGVGLDNLRRWCLQANASDRAAPPLPAEAVEQSRPMALTDMADRLLKNPRMTRKLKSVYGDRLRKIGPKSWRIRLDGLPPNERRELDRP